jgi:hypothetical protein
MKMSISVPDKVWFRLVVLYPNLGPSELAQKALNLLLEQSPDPTEEQLLEYWQSLK